MVKKLSDESEGVVKSPAVETVTVEKSKLEKMMERLERLEYAASKANLGNYDAKQEKQVGTNASVSAYEGEIVMAWELIENIVEKNPLTGVWQEKQTIRLHLDEDKTIDMPYVQFIRRKERKEVTRKARIQQDDGSEIWDVETVTTGLEEPKRFKIDIKFLN